VPAVRLPAALATASLAIGLLAGCSSSGATTTNPAAAQITDQSLNDGFHGILLDDPYQKPTQTFVDTTGKPFRIDRDVKRPVLLMFFGYTHCPDVCSAVVADMAAALRRLDPGLRDRVQVVYVTTDPARDTGPVIASYLQRFDPSFIGLTGSAADIAAAAESLGVAITGKEVVVGGYTIGHGAQVIGFGGGKSVVWVPGTAVSDMRTDIARLATPS
jgi:protein SCO1/2